MTSVIHGQQSRRARKKAATRNKIIETAIRLFSERGIQAVTVDEIAAEADVGKGTIYNYFPAKEDIIVGFMVEFERTVQSQLKNLESRHRSAAAVLTHYIQSELRLKEHHHAFVRVFLGHMFLNTEQFLPHMAEMQNAIDPPLEALFEKLQQQGAIRCDLPLAELILTFKTIQLGLTCLWAIEGPPFARTKQVVKQEILLFCKGLEVRE
jgi:AcrR family transcriptional regulator